MASVQGSPLIPHKYPEDFKVKTELSIKDQLCSESPEPEDTLQTTSNIDSADHPLCSSCSVDPLNNTVCSSSQSKFENAIKVQDETPKSKHQEKVTKEIRERKLRLLKQKLANAKKWKATPHAVNKYHALCDEIQLYSLVSLSDVADDAFKEWKSTSNELQAFGAFKWLQQEFNQYLQHNPNIPDGILIPGFISKNKLLPLQKIYYVLANLNLQIIEKTKRERLRALIGGKQKLMNINQNDLLKVSPVSSSSTKPAPSENTLNTHEEFITAKKTYAGGIYASVFVFSDQCTYQFCLESVTCLLLNKPISERTVAASEPSPQTYSSASKMFIAEVYKHLSHLDDDIAKLNSSSQQEVKALVHSQLHHLIGSHFLRADDHWCKLVDDEGAQEYWSNRLLISFKLQRWSELPLIIWQLDTLITNELLPPAEPLIHCIKDFSALMQSINQQCANGKLFISAFNEPIMSIHTSFTGGYFAYVKRKVEESSDDNHQLIAKQLATEQNQLIIFATAVDNLLYHQMATVPFTDIYENPAPPSTEPSIQDTPSSPSATLTESYKSDDESEDEETTDEVATKKLPLPELDELGLLTHKLQNGKCDADTCLQQYLIFRDNPSISQRHLVLINLNIFEQALFVAAAHCETVRQLTNSVSRYSSELSRGGLAASKRLKYSFVHAVRELPTHFIKIQEALEHVHFFLKTLKEKHSAINLKLLGKDYQTSKELLMEKKTLIDTFLKSIKDKPQQLTDVYKIRFKLLKEGNYLKNLQQSENTLTQAEMTLSIDAAHQLVTFTDEFEKISKEIDELKL